MRVRKMAIPTTMTAIATRPPMSPALLDFAFAGVVGPGVKRAPRKGSKLELVQSPTAFSQRCMCDHPSASSTRLGSFSCPKASAVKFKVVVLLAMNGTVNGTPSAMKLLSTPRIKEAVPFVAV